MDDYDEIPVDKNVSEEGRGEEDDDDEEEEDDGDDENEGNDGNDSARPFSCSDMIRRRLQRRTEVEETPRKTPESVVPDTTKGSSLTLEEIVMEQGDIGALEPQASALEPQASSPLPLKQFEQHSTGSSSVDETSVQHIDVVDEQEAVEKMSSVNQLFPLAHLPILKSGLGPRIRAVGCSRSFVFISTTGKAKHPCPKRKARAEGLLLESTPVADPRVAFARSRPTIFTNSRMESVVLILYQKRNDPQPLVILLGGRHLEESGYRYHRYGCCVAVVGDEIYAVEHQAEARADEMPLHLKLLAGGPLTRHFPSPTMEPWDTIP
ncbi:unnamed protein product [Cylicocyclus nassatus]|uniref:Uncharacterized protein n=1 Tax=Cylicocyclus nassatus TaxID=53992 RepID=A0AA36GYW6_CYLNA|nr:unnamed protein product [Cylicocyclus nassatus]